MNHDVSASLTQLYQDVNAQIASFQAATGLQCPPGCGQCCENPEVESSPLEMVPMALELIRRGDAAAWLEQADIAGVPSRCVFYQPDEHVAGNGRCQMYMWRPSICRLFGFAAVTDKLGTPKLAACFKHKQVYPDQVAMAQVAIANGLPVPQFADWQTQIANVDPHWGYQRMPINQALKIAIERVSLSLAYETQSPANAMPSTESESAPESAYETLE
ncbi:MAG: YkgJ family cysteine cluster protein [Thainema sp.]